MPAAPKSELDDDGRDLLAKLPTDGRGIGNTTLRQQLGWTESKYEQVCRLLLSRGELAVGPGRGGSVKLPKAAKDDELLLARVPTDGGPISNVALQKQLRWDEDRYYKARDRLIDDGVLARGRGRGGTVHRVRAEGGDEVRAKVASTPPRPAPEREREREREDALYGPMVTVLREPWAKDRRFYWSRVEETAKQGRRDTGGRWTRPDLAVVSLHKYQYLPGLHLEVWTFEVKTMDNLDVTAVYEALAHSRSATRAYVVAKLPEQRSPDIEERLQAVQEEAARHGIGVITMANPADYATWEETVEPKRFDSPPDQINEFIATQFSSDFQSALQMQLR